MNGTDKQIKWAEQIKKDNSSHIYLACQYLEKAVNGTTDGSPNNLVFKDTLNKIKSINNIDDAAWWINQRDAVLNQIMMATVQAKPIDKIKGLIAASKNI